MIRLKRTNHDFLGLFLTPDEIKELRSVATYGEQWVPGRQDSGYFKMALPEQEIVTLFRGLAPVYDRARNVLECEMGKNDAYLLYYPRNSYIQWHKDPAPVGHIHRRVNALVELTGSGGELHLDKHGDTRLEVGDALVFDSSETRHAVFNVMGGHRLVLSIGCLIKKDEK